MTDTAADILHLEHVAKDYTIDDTTLHVLTDVSLTLPRGQSIGLVGKSGAGKTTLLNIAATLEQPNNGTVLIKGTDPITMKDRALSKFRNSSIGIVFQFHHLLPEFSARDNVAIPMMLSGSVQTAREKAADLLERVGLADRMDHKPAELSGGEQQRVSVARAISMHPDLLLLDEPTGNLDTETGRHVFELILDLIGGKNLSAIFVTHKLQYTQNLAATYVLEKGEVWKQ